MNTRRAVLCSLCGLAGSLCWPNRARSEEQLISCTDSFAEGDNLVPVASEKLTDSSSLLASTGNPELDAAIKAAILDCYQAYVLRPAFYFVINDPKYERNAFARPIAPGKPSAFGEVAGEIGFGIPYLQKSLADDANGDDTMRIIAHEFGHILQYNLVNVEGHRLYNLLRPDGAVSIKWVELHADFISGIYLATRYLRNPRDMSRLNDTITGDDELQPQYHHGTTAERRRAFRDGFRSRLAINPINNPIFDMAFAAVPYIEKQFPM